MVTDPGGNSGGYLRGSDLYNAVPEVLLFSGRYGDPHVGQENAVGTEHLAQLFFMDVHGIDLIIVDDGTKPRAGKGILCMGILSLKEINVEG